MNRLIFLSFLFFPIIVYAGPTVSQRGGSVIVSHIADSNKSYGGGGSGYDRKVSRHEMEKYYFEGQLRFLKGQKGTLGGKYRGNGENAYWDGYQNAHDGDVRISNISGKWCWVKSPWNDGAEPTFNPEYEWTEKNNNCFDKLNLVGLLMGIFSFVFFVLCFFRLV